MFAYDQAVSEDNAARNQKIRPILDGQHLCQNCQLFSTPNSKPNRLKISVTSYDGTSDPNGSCHE